MEYCSEEKNIYVDFGFTPEEAAVLGLKSKLLCFLNTLDEEKKFPIEDNLSQITLLDLLFHCVRNNIHYKVEFYDKEQDV